MIARYGLLSGMARAPRFVLNCIRRVVCRRGDAWWRPCSRFGRRGSCGRFGVFGGFCLCAGIREALGFYACALASALCVRASSVAPVRGGTYFSLPPQRKVGKRKRLTPPAF